MSGFDPIGFKPTGMILVSLEMPSSIRRVSEVGRNRVGLIGRSPNQAELVDRTPNQAEVTNG